jgi:hypothetical protein
MQNPDRSGRFPDAERLSTMAATILLAYALARYIDLPARSFAMQLPGFYLSFEISVQNVVAVLVAGLTASGANWLIQDHPALGKRSSVPHWILPALTALTISLPLSQLPQSPIWWIGFALGGVLLILVLIAEYIVVDPNDLRYQPAAAGLIAVSFALYLILATALSYSGIRLFLLFPALSIAGGLVSLRTLSLRLQGKWAYTYAGITALITGQMAAALHYWPISPVAFGLALLGPAYALTNFFGNLDEGEPVRQALIEPMVIFILVLLMAIWLG